MRSGHSQKQGSETDGRPSRLGEKTPQAHRVVTLAACLTALVVCGALVQHLLLAGQRVRIHPPEAVCCGHLKMIALALVIYADEHDGRCPDDLRVLDHPDYLAGEWDTLLCPGEQRARHEAGLRGERRGDCDYWYRRPEVYPVMTSSDQPVAMDYVGNHPQTGLVLFADAHVEIRVGDTWWEDVGDGTRPVRPTPQPE